MTVAITWVTINAILGAASVIVLLGLTYYAWSRRHEVKSGQLFTLLMLCEAIRIAGYTLEIVSVDAAGSLTASKLQYVGVFSVLLWFMFTLNFAGFGAFSTRVGGILAALPAVVLLLALTNEYHGLIWQNVSVNATGAFNVFQAEYGSFFYVYFVYTVILLVVGVLLLVRAQIRQWRLYRSQMMFWLGGTLVPAFGHYAMVFGWYIVPNLHPIPLTYMIGAVCMTVAVFRLRLVDVMPIPFDTIFNSSPDAVIVYDLKRRVVAFNPAAAPFAATGVGIGIGMPLDDVFPSVARGLAGGETVSEIRLHNADYRVLLSPSRTRTGKTRGQILILTDITPIRQAEREQRALLAQISRLEQLKTEMIRMAAHDVKSPLATLMGYLEVIRGMDENAPLTSANSYFTVMERSTDSIMRIVRDILSLDRVERMAEDQTMHSVDLVQLTRTCAEELSQNAADKGLTYSVTLSNGTMCVSGDPVQLHEAITNLIGNAIKYTPPGGEVRARVYLEPAAGDGEKDGVVFTVEDTGPGIPQEQQAKLFQPFYRAKTPETARVDGTGLGLYLVKGIVERHSGTMIMRSEYGAGSTFGFRLPLYGSKIAA